MIVSVLAGLCFAAFRAGTRRMRRWQPRLASALGGAAARPPVFVQTEGAARDIALHIKRVLVKQLTGTLNVAWIWLSFTYRQ